MAFSSYMFPDSYTVISSFNYRKQERELEIYIRVYSDELKNILITESSFRLNGNSECIEVLGILDEPPVDASTGDSYLSSENTTGDWKDGKCCIVQKKTEGWRCINTNEPIYVIDEDKYYLIIAPDNNMETRSIAVIPSVFTSSTWNEFFDIGDISKQDNNFIRAMYTYLKTRIEFQGVGDC